MWSRLGLNITYTVERHEKSDHTKARQLAEALELLSSNPCTTRHSDVHNFIYSYENWSDKIDI